MWQFHAVREKGPKLPEELGSLEVEDLVERCNQGDGQAWEEFYGRYVGMISRVVKSYFKSNHEDADDLIQEVFVRLLNALKNFDPTRSLEAYIIEIARRVRIGRLRKASSLKRGGANPRVLPMSVRDCPEGEVHLVLASQAEDQEASLIKAQEARTLRQAILELSDGCRKVLALRYDDGLSYREISEKLAVNEGTLRVRVRRCLSSLAVLYSKVAQQEVREP